MKYILLPEYFLSLILLLLVSRGFSQQADTLTIPGTTVTRNIRYGDADPKQNFDLYLPANSRTPVPLLIWIHGGGWRMGAKKNMELAWLAASGYAIASIDYRFSMDSIFPAQVRDCNAAIRILWKNARQYKLDTSRFIIAGASAGGHLASLVGLSGNNGRQDFYPYPLDEDRVSIKAILNFYGPGDFYAFHGDGAGYKVDSATSSVSLLLGASPLVRPDLAKWASPATYVDKDDPPVLILHGDKDPIIHYYLGVLFYHVLQEAGVKTEMVTLKDAGHGGPAFSDENTRQKVLAFLQEIFPDKTVTASASGAKEPQPGQRSGYYQPADPNTTSLNGDWTFALDPMKIGATEGWSKKEFASDRFDKVRVPHCFSVDKRYEFYTGTAWYFKHFQTGDDRPAAHYFLQFDAVFYKARIWLNGELAGTHEGGYTPFEFDVTGKLKAANTLAVEVDNGWDTTTIPGAKTPVNYESVNAAQVYPWINYGGITRPVRLCSRPDLFVRKIKVVADPDLVKGTARISINVLLKNLSDHPIRSVLNARVYREGRLTSLRFRTVPVTLPAGAETRTILEGILPAKERDLWDQDHPNLYLAEVSVGTDTLSSTFGIRKLQVTGTHLLLNGSPIHMGGANRPLDYPGYGSMDPPAVLQKDMVLMKSGCMELSRINHHAVSENMLNWADRNGMLIIEEAGNWQMTPKQMSDPGMRHKYESQMKEMLERDWNHPSIIAWSVGNEFQSQTEEGKAWVRDMSGFVKGLDTNRLITFASMIVARDQIRNATDEASQYVDFISANIYGDYAKRLQHIHAVYPDKPVYISEFGIRTDGVKNESGRVAHLQNALAAFRQCDFLIGASVWTFNDYQSRFPGTNVNGYRPWGLVSPQREPRGMYTVWQEEFAPAIIEKVSRQGQLLTVKITARKDFPSYVLKDYQLGYQGGTIPVPALRPGESRELTIDLPAGQNEGAVEVSLIKPGGFTILKKVF